MTDRAWPGWDQPGVQQITGMSVTEWEWRWSSGRKFATELGLRLDAHQVEDVPWGAIRWTWKKGELYYEPVFAGSLDEVERVQKSARRSMGAGVRGALVGILVAALVVLFTSPHGIHWWDLLIVLAGAVAGFLVGTGVGRVRHVVAVGGEPAGQARAIDDLPAIMETWRALRAIQDRRRLFRPLSRVYARAVIDFHGPREHVRTAEELSAILQSLEASVVSICDIREMDELTRTVEGAIETMADAVDLDPRTSAAMSEQLKGLSIDIALTVRARRREEQALRAHIGLDADAERDLEAFRAEQAIKAATAQLEQVRRTYRIEAELSDLGMGRLGGTRVRYPDDPEEREEPDQEHRSIRRAALDADDA